MSDLEVQLVTLTANQVRNLVKTAVIHTLEEIQRVKAADDRHISPKDAAKLLRTREAKVYAAIRSEQLPASKAGRSYLLKASDVRKWGQEQLGRG